MPMSFSSDVKAELAEYIAEARHCLIAELSAMLSMSARVRKRKEGYEIIFSTENIAVARKLAIYISNGFNYISQVSVRTAGHAGKNHIYTIKVEDCTVAEQILMAARLMTADEEPAPDMMLKSSMVIKNECCKRAFIRGAFLTSGSMSDPEKFYHFEIVCPTQRKAEFIQSILAGFTFDARISSPVRVDVL